MSSRAALFAVIVACSSAAPLAEPAKETVLVPPDPVLHGTVRVSLVTDAGAVPCVLDADRAPEAVALFTGLARGGASWRDPDSGLVRKDALYRDRPFHRVIPGALIQGGCPRGDGTGHPGYRIVVEPGGADVLRAPGALVLARYTPPPGREDPSPPPPGHVLGSQFGITLAPMPHLDGQVTVLGRCDALDIVRRIAETSDPEERARLRRVDVN